MLYKGFKKDLLLFLAIIGDLYREISLSTYYKRLYYPDYKPRYLSQQISRMAKAGEIEKKEIKGEVVLEIKSRGLKLLDETIPLRELEEKKWDMIWRIVIFDIEEKNKYLRDRIREKLKSLGFGKWQRSVYITPHPVLEKINEYLQAQKLFPRCVCLEARQTGIGDDKKLANFVFRLEKLNIEYLRIAEEADFLLNHPENQTKALEKIRQLWRQFQETLFSDPHLPKELLPSDWHKEEVKKNLTLLTKKYS